MTTDIVVPPPRMLNRERAIEEIVAVFVRSVDDIERSVTEDDPLIFDGIAAALRREESRIAYLFLQPIIDDYARFVRSQPEERTPA